MKYQVAPSKNDFLLFTAMNLSGYNDNNGSYKLHPLRESVRCHFAKEINNEYVLRFGEEFRRKGMKRYSFQDAFGELQRPEIGLKPDPVVAKRCENEIALLQKIRESTDFDGYYDDMALPVYERICDEVSSVLAGKGLFDILDDAWETKPEFDVRIVPRPLVAPYCGNGPRVDRYALAFVGPGIGRDDGRVTFAHPNVLHLIGHESGHSYADIVWNEVMLAAKARTLEKEMDEFSRKQRVLPDYAGETVLIETMMRAMQARYIDPKLYPGTDSPEKQLIREHEKGFKHIFKFDEAIVRHKEHPKGTLAEDLFDYCVHVDFED
jgi:hypothetical protein